MTWPTILSRSRPPPRGPLRSSAGRGRGDAVEDVPGGLDEAASRSASAPRSTGRRSDRRSARDAEVGAAAASACARRRRASAPVVGELDAAARRRRRVARRHTRAAPRARAPRSCRRGTSRASRRPSRTPSSGRTLAIEPRRAMPGRRWVSVAAREARDEAREGRRHRGRPAERVDERRCDDDAVGTGLGEGPDMGRPADPEPDGDRDRRGGHDVADKAADRDGKRGPGAGDADEGDAVQEPAAPGRDLARGARRGRRGDEVDDGEPGSAGDRLEWAALVGCQVGDDEPDAPASTAARAASRPSPPPMNWFA